MTSFTLLESCHEVAQCTASVWIPKAQDVFKEEQKTGL